MTVAAFLATLPLPHQSQKLDGLDMILELIEDPDTTPFAQFLDIVQTELSETAPLRLQAEEFETSLLAVA